MLHQITPTYLEELHKLVHSSMWPEIRKQLEAEYDATVLRILNTANEAEIHELRGRAKFIRDLFDVSIKTREYLDKIHKRSTP